MSKIDELYEFMLSNMCIRYKQTQKSLEDIMDRVAYHESKGIADCKQLGGGPGRGLFQYETGANQGGMTARNRLASWYTGQGVDTPNWLNQEDMENSGFDASLLDEQQQRMLFLADKRYDETASLRPDDIQDAGKWWAKHHWKGGEEGSDIYNKRVSSFNEDLMMDDVVKEQGADAFGSKFGTGEGKIANFFKGVFE